MRMEIICGGNHDPPHLQHYMIVDNHGVLLDLSQVRGGALDNPDVVRLEWNDALPKVDPRYAPGQMTVRPRGAEATARAPFWDRAMISPYLIAYRTRRAELEATGEEATKIAHEAAERELFEQLKAKFEPPAASEVNLDRLVPRYPDP